jgi:predicted metal-dependent HD superfamily phosphohydrolase
MLKDTFYTLAGNYTSNSSLIEACWTEIEKSYSHPKRHYHTLTHLENLLRVLQEVRASVSDWNTMLFTLFYHDAVYNALKSDNEEKSAGLAAQRMHELQVPTAQIEQCRNQILATKQHKENSDADTNFFTDADLSILGADWNAYAAYAADVRKEYAMYPDLLYKPGRRKVLQHFLNMEHIFKTAHFREKFESQARLNLQKELENLL